MNGTRRIKKVNIGIVSSPVILKRIKHAQSYIDKVYIHWVEMSGANAVIIPYNTDMLPEYLKLVHGVVLAGGAISNVKTHSDKQYKDLIHVVRRIFEHAVRENDCGNYFPLWGTCLGFELLAMMPEHIDHDYFKRLQLEHKFRLGTLIFTGASRLRKAFPKALQEKVARTPTVNHMHQYGFNMDAPHTIKLMRYLNIVSVDRADDGSEFMNMYEYKHYPFYGSQWHPEKPLTDLGVDLSYTLSLFLKKECAHNKKVPPRWSKTLDPVHLNSPFAVLVRGGTTV